MGIELRSVAAGLALVYLTLLTNAPYPVHAAPPQTTSTYSEPAQPEPSEVVKNLFEEANGLAHSGDYSGALKTVDRALKIAQQTHDLTGEVRAHRGRAIFLERLKRIDEAVGEWKISAAGWRSIGDGPGEIEALGMAGYLELNKKTSEANELLERALSLCEQERIRPFAAAQTVTRIAGLIADQGEDLEAAASYYAQALAVEERLEPNSLHVAAILTNLAFVAQKEADLERAAKYLNQALAIRKKLEPDSLGVADNLYNLGNLLGSQGHLDEAANHFREALGIQEKLEPGTLDVAASLAGLGDVAEAQGDLKAAANYDRQALMIREKQEAETPEVAAFLTRVGFVAQKLGDLKAAADYFNQALAIRKKLVPDSIDVAMTLGVLGDLAQDEAVVDRNQANLNHAQADVKRAADYYRESLTIRKKLDPDSMDMAMNLYGLGFVIGEEDDGDLNEARDDLQKALVIQEKLDPATLGVAASLASLGIVAQKQGNLEEALESWRRALNIQEKLEPGSLDLAVTLNDLGYVIANQGQDLKAAASYYGQALAIEEKLEPNSLDVSASLSGLGVVAQKQGDVERVTELLRRALDIQEKLKPDSLDLTINLYNLGNALVAQGHFDEAGDCFRKALSIHQKLEPGTLSMAANLDGLASVAQNQGDPRAAEHYDEQALAIRQKVKPESVNVAQELNDLGTLTSKRGDLQIGAEYYRQAQAILEKLAPGSLDVAFGLTGLGNAAVEWGDLEGGTEYYRQALAIYEKQAPESTYVAGSLSSLGRVAQELGDLTSAENYQRRALKISEKLSPSSLDLADILNSLGNVVWDRGNLKEAADYYADALAIDEKLAPNSREIAMTLYNSADLAYAQHDLDAAARDHQRALAIREKVSPDSLDVAASLVRVAAIARLRGDPKTGEEYEQRALRIQEALAPDSLHLAETLNRIAVSNWFSGHLDQAEVEATRAWRIVQHRAQGLISNEARQAFDSRIQVDAGVLMSIQVERNESEAALVTLEESRSQVLSRLLVERQEMLKQTEGDLWPRHQQALAKLQHAEEVFTNAERIPSDTPEVRHRVENASEEYEKAKNQVDQLWAEIQKQQPRAFLPTVNLVDARRTLGPTATFIAFSLWHDRAFVFAVVGGDDATTVLAKRLEPVAEKGSQNQQQRLVDFVNLLLDFSQRSGTTPPPGSGPGLSNAAERELALQGRTLFDLLFPGEVGDLVRKSKRLIISPDGPLWQLPFAALVTGLDSKEKPIYLGEQTPITYAPSLSLFTQIKNQPPHLKRGQPPEALVLGDPDFDRKVELDPKDPAGRRLWAGLYPPGSRPERLNATSEEATIIARLYGRDPLTGENATEAELRKRLETADVIHLATHGLFQAAVPMSSAIALTPPAVEPAIGDTNNDGALQAWEIFSQLNLRSELVVLSACETARGRVVRGEGIVGLTRALQYAGARSIVATQWSVAAGESTAELMEEFHLNLRKGLAKDEALREAMSTIRNRYPHPFYWAPFILLGDPDNPNLGRN